MSRPLSGPTTYIVSRFADPTFIRESGTVYRGTVFPTNAEIRASAAEAHGGRDADYAVIWNSDKHVLQRMLDGHAHEVTWDGVDEDVDAVYNYTAEDDKWILRATASVADLLADNTATSTITFEARRQSNGNIVTSVNGAVIIPVQSPTGTRYVRLTFANGVATLIFRAPASQSGDWIFPAPHFAQANAKVDAISVVQVRVFVTGF